MKLCHLLLGVSLLAGTSCANKQHENSQSLVRPVCIEKVSSLGSIDKTYPGIVEAKEYSKLAFKISGPLIKMAVDAGSKVRKGTILAEIDPLDYRLNNDANKAAYLTAKSKVERNKKLLKMEAISLQEYEMAEAEFVRARSAYNASQNTLKETRLVAPFDGLIEVKYVENYQKIQVGEPIVKLINPEKLQISFTIPETSNEITRSDLAINVEFDTYRGHYFSAKIKEVIDALPDGSGIPVKLELNDSSFNRMKYAIYPGFSCKVVLKEKTSKTRRLAVPISAVYRDLQTKQSYLWIYSESTSQVTKREVELGQIMGTDKMEITKGITGDEMIVSAGINFLVDGQKVNILK